MKCSSISRLIVTTDSEKIAEISKSEGAEVPFMRPKEISKSDSMEKEFLDHALNWLKKNEGYEPEYIVILYPTSPFRKTESIDQAIKKIINHPEADSLRSVTLCHEHPYKMWQLTNNCLIPLMKDDDPNKHTFSYHLLPEIFVQNASINITKLSTIRNNVSYLGEVIMPFVMDEVESIDLNDTLDFEYAELMMKRHQKDEL